MTEPLDLKLERLKTAMYIALYRRNKYPYSDAAYKQWLRAKQEYEALKKENT